MASSNLLGRMRFIIKQAGSGSERVGTISGLTRLPGVQIETPTAALSTKGGSVAHLTADVLSWVFTEPQLLWLPLASTLNLEKGARAQGDGVAKFVGLPNHVHCAALNDINETVPGGHFEGDTVPLWTRNGKKKISADRYMDVMEVLKPDIVLAIADGRLSLNESHKRISKSVFRTCSMLEKCISRFKTSGTLHESALIGVIVGASRDKECADCLQQVLLHKDSLSGVALSGLTEGAHEPVNIEQLVPIFKNLGESLPKDLLRIVEGCWNPEVVVAAVELGWDVFDGSYPAKLTNAGQALRLLFGEWKGDGTACILDLNDKRYKEDFSPILDDCECLACRKHSRAYIHHLLNTRELLATVLLSMHNLHHFDQMFKHARNHISANTFQIFKSSITHQYEAYREKQLLIERHKDLNSVQETVPETETNKKKRMMNGDTSKTEEFKNS